MLGDTNQPKLYSNEQYSDHNKCCFSSANNSGDTLFCCRCAHKRKASPLTCIAICFLVLTYNLFGGFLFLALEGSSSEETSVAASMPNLSHSQGLSQELRTKTVEKLWSITEDLNILYKENWTKLAAKELVDFQKVLLKTMKGGSVVENRITFEEGDRYKWTFSTSILYALTLITTIGHGNVTPRSQIGKMVAIAYACVGIPLIMLYLSTIGDILARNFRVLYSRVNPSSIKTTDYHTKGSCINKRKTSTEDGCTQTPFHAALNLDNINGGFHWICRDHTRVPIALSLLLIFLYVGLGTIIFNKTERWTYIDGCYFSFSSLATIGFGDLKPGLYGSTVSTKAEDLAVGICCIYILVGIVVVAMCFNLIQEDLGSILRGMTLFCGGRSKSRVVHGENVCEDRIGMSLVS